MRTIGRFVGCVMGALLPLTVHAATGTCTITTLVQRNLNLGLDFGIPVAAGFAMPIGFDEAAGTFSMTRDAWYDQFGDLGAQFGTVQPDIHGYLRMYDGTSTGTVDAAGGIRLPDFPVENSTDYQQPPGIYPDYPVTDLDLITGLQVRVLSNKPYVLEGEPLDFATGRVRLYGVGFLAASVGSSGTNVSGIDMVCTMAPIPSQASLPLAPSLSRVAGKAKVDSSFEDGDKGDRLTLKFSMARGATATDLSGAGDFILRLGEVTLLVRGGNFQVKGKRLLAKRDDTCKLKKGETQGICKADPSRTCATFGDCAPAAKLEVVSGQKATSAASSKLGGQLAIANTKKGALVSLKIDGLDLAALSGAQTLRTAIGPANARIAVTVAGGTIK